MVGKATIIYMHTQQFRHARNDENSAETRTQGIYVLADLINSIEQ